MLVLENSCALGSSPLYKAICVVPLPNSRGFVPYRVLGRRDVLSLQRFKHPYIVGATAIARM